MNLLTVVGAVMTVSLLAINTEACSCAPTTLREFYCKSHFAVKAWVSNWTSEGLPPNGLSTYTLNIVRAFKLPVAYRNETQLTVHSVDNEAMCGINPGHRHRRLDRGRLGQRHNSYIRYFITVNKKEDGQLWATLCKNTYRMWRWLSRAERREIQNFENLTC